MAKLSELIPAMATATGLSEGSVLTYAQQLRKAGLIQTGGRGLGSPDMNETDITNLLLAILATDSPSQSPNEVIQIRQYLITNEILRDYINRFDVKFLKSTLGEAIEQIIFEIFTVSFDSIEKEALPEYEFIFNRLSQYDDTKDFEINYWCHNSEDASYKITFRFNPPDGWFFGRKDLANGLPRAYYPSKIGSKVNFHSWAIAYIRYEIGEFNSSAESRWKIYSQTEFELRHLKQACFEEEPWFCCFEG
ncbi:MAG: hypothetical protein ACFB2Z_13365 [Maricaulaceae bacterium]